MGKPELRDDLLKAVGRRDGRRTISCAMAHEIAKRLNVPVTEVGKLCNAQGIKIVRCQLGCF